MITGSRNPAPSGMAFGAGAYLIWGMFPAFFGLLASAGPVEILAHRIVWTLLLMLVVLAVMGRLRGLIGIGPRTWGLVVAASAAIALNWVTYIYGVTSDQVVQCALGYFVNPLVSVLLGVVLFRERLVRAQVVALVLAGIAVVVLTVDYGRPPWIAIILALSFATYGLVKKVVPLDPPRSLAAEGVVAAPFALGYLIFIGAAGTATFTTSGTGHLLLLLACGPVTTVPLLLFGAAAQRLPLVTMGILQYLTPALQMAWGVAVMHEAMPASRWLGFGLIWLALVIFTTDAVRRVRKSRRTSSVTVVTPQRAS